MYPFQMFGLYKDRLVLEIPSHPNSMCQYKAEIPGAAHLKSRGIGNIKRQQFLHEYT